MPITVGVVFVFQQQRGATFLGLRLPVPLRRAEGALQYSSTGLGGGVRGVRVCLASCVGARCLVGAGGSSRSRGS